MMLPRRYFQSLLTALALFVSLNNKSYICDPMEDPDFKGRYRDDVSISVLSGTNATFNYTMYPFDEIHRIIFYKTRPQDYEQRCLTCVLSNVRNTCDYYVDRYTVMFKGNGQPYIVLHNTTAEDSGKYRTRIIKNDVPINPSLIDIITFMKIFRMDDFRISIDVTNSPGANFSVSPQISPSDSTDRQKIPVMISLDQIHTWNIRLQSTSPSANITLRKWTGTKSSTTRCVNVLSLCSDGIQFFQEDSQPWTLLVKVYFNAQNVPEVSAEFPVLLQGRFAEKVSINVLVGSDTTFDHIKHPFNGTFHIIFDKVTRETFVNLGRCVVRKNDYHCNRTVDRVTFMSSSQKVPIIILLKTRKSDAGRYRTRVFADKVQINQKTKDMHAIETSVTVYDESDFIVSVDVTNVPGATYNISLKQTPFSYAKSIEVVPGLTHTWSVKLRSTSPQANISLTQWIDNNSKTSTCSHSQRCFEDITISSNYSQTLTVSVNVNFNTQNVPNVTAHFPDIVVARVAAVNSPDMFETWVTAFVLISVVFVVGVFVAVLIIRKKREQHCKGLRTKLMADERTFSPSDFLVPENELEIPDYVYKVHLLTDTRSNNAQVVYVKIIILTTALMNTSGGVIQCHLKGSGRRNWFTNFVRQSIVRTWFMCYKQYLGEYIPSSITKPFIRFKVEANSFTVYVLPSQRLACLDDGLGPKGFDHAVTDNDITHFCKLLELMSDEHLVVSDQKHFLETMHLAKCVPLTQLVLTDPVKQVVSDRLEEYIKGSGGGNFLFGVNDEDTKKPVQFIGFNSAVDVETFSKSVNSLFERVAKKCGVWKSNVFYHCVLKKVHLHESQHSDPEKFILIWHIYGKQEKRLYRLPTAFGVDFHGTIFSYTRNDFHRFFGRTNLKLNTTQTKEYGNHGRDAAETDYLLDREGQLTDQLKTRRQIGKPTPSVSPINTPENNTWYREEEMKTATEKAISNSVLSWTENSMTWNITGVFQEFKQSEIVESFSSTCPFKFIPPIDDVLQHVSADLKASLRTFLSGVTNSKRSGYALMLRESMIGDDESAGQHLIVDIHDLYFAIVSMDNPIEIIAFKMEGDPDFKSRIFINVRKFKRTLSLLLSDLGCFKSAQILSMDIKEVKLSHHPDLPANERKLIKDEYLSNLQNVEKIHIEFVNTALFNLPMTTYVKMQTQFGEHRHLKLSQEQLHTIRRPNKTFNIIDGPPGSGKSVLSIFVYRQQSSKVLFASPAAAFIEFCIFQGIPENNTLVLNNQNTLSALVEKTNSHNVVIIDDTHLIQALPERAWVALFQAIYQHECKLFLFGDSVFQTYRNVDTFNDILCFLTKFCEDRGVDICEYTLTEVHRNSRKVFSFIESNRPENAGLNQMSCKHKAVGDDIIIYPINNYKDESKMNGLIDIVKSLLGHDPSGGFYHHPVIYTPSDIALLIDSDQDEEDVQFFMKLFGHHLRHLETQRVSTFPVRGMVIETLDNFVGLECNVCISVQGPTTNRTRNMQNERYKIYIASRAVRLVIFVQSKHSLTIEMAEKLHFDKLANVVNNYYSDGFRDLTDLHAILGVVANARDDKVVHGALSAIIEELYKNREATACRFIENHGIEIVINHIKTMIVQCQKFREKLLLPDVLNSVRGALRNKGSEAWEACYLLCHLVDFEGGWPLGSKDFEIMQRDAQRTISGWTKDDSIDVAQRDIDFRTYETWLKSSISIQMYMAAWSLINLILTKDVLKYIGMQTLTDILEVPMISPELKDMFREILHTRERRVNREYL